MRSEYEILIVSLLTKRNEKESKSSEHCWSQWSDGPCVAVDPCLTTIFFQY